MTQQSAENQTYRMPNSVSSTKRVYMRNKDMSDFETELETSRLAAENPDDPASVQPVEPEKPNSAESPSNDPYEKRYKDLQSYMTKEVNKLKESLTAKDSTITELSTKLKEVNKPAMPTTEEEFQSWIEQFPPLYNIMRTVVLKESGNDPEIKELKEKLKEVDDFRQSLANERGKLELLKIHSDAEEYDTDGAKNAEFGEWYKEQEPEIQALVDSGSPAKIGKAITLYKREKGIVTKTAQDKKKELSKGINVGPTQPNLPKEGKVYRESEVSKMNSRQYAKEESEIEKARSEGRYIYDISRASL